MTTFKIELRETKENPLFLHSTHSTFSDMFQELKKVVNSSPDMSFCDAGKYSESEISDEIESHLNRGGFWAQFDKGDEYDQSKWRLFVSKEDDTEKYRYDDAYNKLYVWNEDDQAYDYACSNPFRLSEQELIDEYEEEMLQSFLYDDID